MYVDHDLAGDGGAVQEIAEREAVAFADLKDLARAYGDDANAIARAIVAECKRRRARA